MKTADFSFKLPPHLIAQFPPEKRGDSRLMVLDRKTGGRSHHGVADLPRLLEPGTLLVFNNSRVRKARLSAVSEITGAQVEFLLLQQLDECTWKTLVSRTKRRHPGSRYVFEQGVRGRIIGEDQGYRFLCFNQPIDDQWLDQHGHIPLPPYIKREDAPQDSERYQTVYGKILGSSAAPTAGLHFTQELLDALVQQGMETVFITLHVGLGTFLPVRTEHIEDHTMHKEVFTIDNAAAQRIETAKAEGRRILAVGTTSLRALESAWRGGSLARGKQATSIFIYPGYAFKVVDGLFTNFHTPVSTLLMLVSAFAGREFILESYQAAVQEGYRFFSYGDGMLIR